MVQVTYPGVYIQEVTGPGVIAGVATWEIVQSAVFATSVSRWLTLANGLLIATLACAGLIAYVMTTVKF